MGVLVRSPEYLAGYTPPVPAPVVAAVTGTTGATTTSLSVTMPSGISAGHLLVCFVATETVNTNTPSMTGWTARANSAWTTASGEIMSMWVFDKIAAGSDTGTVALASSAYTKAWTYRITGATATPYDVSSSGDTGASKPVQVTPTAVTTTTANELVLIGIGGVFSNYSSTALSGWTKDGTFDANADVGFSLTQATAATVTPPTTTGSSGATAQAYITIAYKSS